MGEPNAETITSFAQLAFSYLEVRFLLALGWCDLLFDCSDISRAGKSIPRKCGNVRLLLLIDNGVSMYLHVCSNLSRVKSYCVALLFLYGHPNDV